MPSLKDLKIRINTVKSTQKITTAMKLVASAKLRKAQEKAVSSRPYALRMSNIISELASNLDSDSGPELLFGRGKQDKVLLIAVSADRGLCGGFNSNIIKEVRRKVDELETSGKEAKLIFIGSKLNNVLKNSMKKNIVASFSGLQGDNISFSKVVPITDKIISLFESGEINKVDLVFNKFQSVISQIVTSKTLVPAEISSEDNQENKSSPFEYEPDDNSILDELIPRNLSTQIYSAIIESNAGELAARMTAMDNATRNAGELIDRLTLVYNRTRQTFITNELIEIISGAEAV